MFTLPSRKQIWSYCDSVFGCVRFSACAGGWLQIVWPLHGGAEAPIQSTFQNKPPAIDLHPDLAHVSSICWTDSTNLWTTAVFVGPDPMALWSKIPAEACFMSAVTKNGKNFAPTHHCLAIYTPLCAISASKVGCETAPHRQDLPDMLVDHKILNCKA